MVQKGVTFWALAFKSRRIDKISQVTDFTVGRCRTKRQMHPMTDQRKRKRLAARREEFITKLADCKEPLFFVE